MGTDCIVAHYLPIMVQSPCQPCAMVKWDKVLSNQCQARGAKIQRFQVQIPTVIQQLKYIVYTETKECKDHEGNKTLWLSILAKRISSEDKDYQKEKNNISGHLIRRGHKRYDVIQAIKKTHSTDRKELLKYKEKSSHK